MSKIGDSKRQRVWDKTGGKCFYCGTDLTPHERTEIGNKWTISGTAYCVDHIVPKTLGGTNDDDNLVPACQTCNLKKGNKHVEDYRLALALERNNIPEFTPEQLKWLRSHGCSTPIEDALSRVVFYAEETEQAR